MRSRRSPRSSTALIAVLLVASCRQRESPPPAPRAPSTESPSASSQSGALAPVRGDTPDIALIRHEQDLARQRHGDARPLVELARLFIAHAREYEDSTYYEQASDAVRRAREVAPEDPSVLTMDAFLLLQNHRFREAQDVARRLVAVAPSADAYGILSDSALELGDYATAVDAAQHMVDTRPDAASYTRASWLRWIHGDAPGAVEVMQLALGSLPRSPQARAWIITQMGVLHWNQGQLAVAQRYFTDALQADPTFSSAHAGLARVLMAQSDFAGAVREVESALRANPSTEHEWLAGDVFAAAGRAPESATHYAAVERIGQRSDPRTLSLFLSTKSRNPELALELAQREFENRQDVFTEDALAWALYRSGRLADAATHAAAARRTGIRDARILYHAGVIALATQHTPEGIAALTDAVTLNPNWDPVEPSEARRLLLEHAAPAAAH